MKNAEKIFMAINNVDERLIDEAKPEDEKPVLIRVEKRLPIKEIMGFAACFAVLVVGFFAIMNFRFNDIDPGDSNINTSGSESDPDDPDISPENKELQAILKNITANAMQLDGTFTRLSDFGDESYLMKFDGDTYYLCDFYPIVDNRKTEPWLLGVPQTQSELKRQLLTYFTERSAEYYMDYVTTGRITTNDEGQAVIIAEPCGGGARVRLIEIDGKMYSEPYEYSDVRLDIDPATAMVTSKTDKTIKFTYWHTDGTVSDTEGVLFFENGGWKFDYFFDVGFIPVMPTEFTDEDKELQDILNELSAADTLYTWFCHGTVIDKEYSFRNSLYPNSQYEYALLPKGKKDPYSGLEYPQSYEQLEELLLKYFTRENVDKYMKNAAKGTMSENSDGTYTVTTDKEGKYLPIFIEIDGNMYLWFRASGGPEQPVWNTARITEKTDNSIKFTIVYTIFDEYYAKDGLIKYERGGWKLNYDWDTFPGENPELTKEDEELREILTNLAANAVELDGMFTNPGNRSDLYPLKVNETDHSGAYYPIADEDRTQPNGLFAMPKNRSELETMLLTTFTRRAAQSYMQYVGTGIFVTDTDGSTVINGIGEFDGEKTFLEIDGRLYHYIYGVGLAWPCDPETAHVISKTDKTIRFSYQRRNWDNGTGTIVFEDGGWKLDYFYSEGFIPELPTEFTKEDDELNDILNLLSAGYKILDLFHHAEDDQNIKTYKFVFTESDPRAVPCIKLPTGKFSNSGENYPRSLDELKELMLKYFTQQTVEYFMQQACRVNNESFTENSDGTYSVAQISDPIPSILEINGEMYSVLHANSVYSPPVPNSAKVIEKTNDSVKYSCTRKYDKAHYYNCEDTIEYERGGWKLDKYPYKHN